MSLYVSVLAEQERELWGGMTAGDLADELRVARLLLRRWLQAEAEGDLATGAMTFRSSEAENGSGVATDKRELSVAVPHYGDLAMKQLELIRKLELAQAQLRGREAVAMTPLGVDFAPDEPGPDSGFADAMGDDDACGE